MSTEPVQTNTDDSPLLSLQHRVTELERWASSYDYGVLRSAPPKRLEPTHANTPAELTAQVERLVNQLGSLLAMIPIGQPAARKAQEALALARIIREAMPGYPD